MSKYLRPALYGLFGLAVIGVGATFLFTGGSEPEPENPVPVAGGTDVPDAETMAPEDEYDTTFGGEATADTSAETAPLDLNARPAPAAAEAAPAPVAVPAGPRVVSYKLRPKDVLSKVATKFGCKLDDIYRLNTGINDKNAHKVRAGQKIMVLNVKNVTDGIEEIAPANGTTATVSNSGSGGEVSPAVEFTGDPTRPAGAAVAAPEIEPLPPTPAAKETEQPTEPDWSTARKHVLKHGDNYFDLSQRYYGAYSFWRHIRDANPQWKVMDTQPGMEIIIPALKPEEASRPALPKAPNASSSIIPPRK